MLRILREMNDHVVLAMPAIVGDRLLEAEQKNANHEVEAAAREFCMALLNHVRAKKSNGRAAAG